MQPRRGLFKHEPVTVRRCAAATKIASVKVRHLLPESRLGLDATPKVDAVFLDHLVPGPIVADLERIPKITSPHDAYRALRHPVAMMVFVEDSHPVLASERGLRRLLLGFRRDGVGEECPHIDTPFGYFP